MLAFTVSSTASPPPPPPKPLGWLAPRDSLRIAASPWGVQAGDDERPDLLDRAQALGVKWTRLLASWPAIESARGRYDFAVLDQAVTDALARGITPFVCLTGGNALYSPTLPPPEPGWHLIYGERPAPPIGGARALAAWLRFVDAAVARFAGRVFHWEIWNEPNHRAYWGQPPDAADYGRLVGVTAERIRARAPDAKIVAGSLAGLDPEFLARVLAEDAGRQIDVISFHHYASLPEARIQLADDIWHVMRAHDPRLVLWQGECGFPSHSSTTDFRGTSPWGLMVQAKWLLRQAFVDTYFLRAALSSYFKLYDGGDRAAVQPRGKGRAIDRLLGFPAPAEGRRVRRDGVNEKCLLANPTLAPKPAFFAYRNLCALIDARHVPVEIGARTALRVTAAGQFAGIGAHDDAYPSQPLVVAYRTAAGATLVAWWLPWHPQEYILRPAQIALSLPVEWELAEPVLVNLLDGSVHAVPRPRRATGGASWVFASLPLYDFPLVLADRADVPLVASPTSPPDDAVPDAAILSSVLQPQTPIA